MRKLRELHKELEIDLIEMLTIVEKFLHEEPYSKAEILQVLNATDRDLDMYSLTENTRHVEQFKLKQRAEHVFQGKFCDMWLLKITFFQ